MPRVADYADVEYAKTSDEHGMLQISGATRFRVGDKLKLIPGHCDPTVNLYDWHLRGGEHCRYLSPPTPALLSHLRGGELFRALGLSYGPLLSQGHEWHLLKR